MKSRLWLWSIAICVCASMALSSQLSAQNNPHHHPKHHQYKLYDVGTFGGPNSYGSWGSISLSSAGTIGFADTTLLDPFYPVCFFDCYVAHAFLWRNGHMTDLGALPGNNRGNSAWAWAVNNSGLAVGISENGNTDPATGFPSTSPVAWLNGHIFNLGGFGGTQGQAVMVNDRGQIVGAASNLVADPYSFWQYFPYYWPTTQVRAFIWEGGRMHDIGTLGGPDAFPLTISESGLVAGYSYTSFTPNPDSGVPIVDPFLWDGRHMTDLGGFGGTYGQANWVNNKGQVVGNSNLAGDLTSHGFLWDHAVLTDLGILPGMTNSSALWINESGSTVGYSFVQGVVGSAVLWDHGQVTELGKLSGYNYAWASSINNSQQVVGTSCVQPCPDFSVYRGFLWENGDMVDLNALVQPPSDIVVVEPAQIDDRGEIVSAAVLPSGDVHTVVLVPNGDCDRDCEQRIVDSQNNPPAVRLMNKNITMPRYGKPADWLRSPLGQRSGMLAPRGLPLN